VNTTPLEATAAREAEAATPRRELTRDPRPRGESLVFLTGGALAIAILMIALLAGIIVWQGFSSFWQGPIVELTLTDGSKALGTIEDRELDPDGRPRVLVRVGNRDLYGVDFRWISEHDVASKRFPDDALLLERREWGHAFGYVAEIREGETRTPVPRERGADAIAAALPAAAARVDTIAGIEVDEIGEINEEIESIRLRKLRVEWDHRGESRRPEAELAALDEEKRGLDGRYQSALTSLRAAREEDAARAFTLETSDGRTKEMPVSEIVRSVPANRLSLVEKVGLFVSRFAEFVFDDPRESNTEGGIFPAIYGTVLMTLLMTLAVVPFGVVGALYLREYAKQGALVSAVRIAVNNLAGVPSIVFGVFGLGFFCYAVGGTIDTLLYPERLPTPTFGGGGLLWASLTLALLTVPVVVVATEEALAAVPNSLREASYGCGASRFQTVWRVVLPRAMPGILTGTILAMARGAGEVAPLMLTGAVNLAPALPLDGTPPFFHPERRFMHLGLQIYGVGFQSPNADAARPKVFATALLLLLVVLVLNVAAILVRNRLRKKFRSATFG